MVALLLLQMSVVYTIVVAVQMLGLPMILWVFPKQLYK
jgi:hypothetical protein